jgi:hypothetical protein
MSVDESELPTKAVDNSVDYAGAKVLSVGFYYRFVKLTKLESVKFIYIIQ